MFPSISRLFFRWRGRKSIARLVGGLWPNLPPLDPPLMLGRGQESFVGHLNFGVLLNLVVFLYNFRLLQHKCIYFGDGLNM